MGKKLLNDEERRTSYLWHKIREGALTRGLSWELTKEFVSNITKKNCYYCGKNPSNKLTAKIFKIIIIYQGVDRMNNSLGYISDNCVPCCKTCNRFKSGQNLDDFLKRIKAIYEHLFSFKNV